MIIAARAVSGVLGTAACWNWGLADTLKLVEATEATLTAQVASFLPTCGISLTISEGSFSPDVCQFEIITGGMYCRNYNECKPDYVVAMSNSNATLDEVYNIVFFNIRGSERGTYRFDPARGLAELRGQMIDRGGIARALSSGVVTLDARGADQVFVSFEALFDNGVTVQGSGLIGVKRLSAP